uniref:Cyclin IaZm n=1 Tax=Arundo donax TaxID=35708 RepID=A0A0A9DIF3_ARUDO
MKLRSGGGDPGGVVVARGHLFLLVALGLAEEPG